MADLEPNLCAFFEEYARISNDALKDPPVVDTDRLAICFAPYVVGSAPQGVFGAANDDGFLAAMQQGFAHYRQIGGETMEITGLSITQLNALHASASVEWAFSYRSKTGGRGDIRFTNIYFLTLAGGPPKIFAYITADEEKAKRDHGLV